MAIIKIKPKPLKTPAELEKEASELVKANLNKLRADTFIDLLEFVAALPGAPQSIKAAATLAAAEKAKLQQ